MSGPCASRQWVRNSSCVVPGLRFNIVTSWIMVCSPVLQSEEGAAVADDGLAGDVGGVVAGEEQRHGADVALGIADAPQGCSSLDGVFQRRVLAEGVQQRWRGG